MASDPVFAEHDTVPATPSARRGCGPSTTASGARRSPTRSWSWSAARPGARSSTGPPADYSTRGGALRAGGGFLDSDTVVSRGSWRAARPRPGRLAAVDGLRRGEADAAFLAVRPPGHHALPDRAMGFCLINNVAVTAAALPPGVSGCAWSTTRPHATGPARVLRRLARRVRVVSRVAALPRHRPPDETGTGRAAGTTCNVPLPAGATGDVYLMALDEVVEPFVERFAPDWLLVSAGFDAHRDDPITGLGLSAGDFADVTARVAGMAPRGRLIAFLEGGYDLAGCATPSRRRCPRCSARPSPRDRVEPATARSRPVSVRGRRTALAAVVGPSVGQNGS